MREKAEAFIRQYYQESQLEGVSDRLEEVEKQILDRGTYDHRPDELSYGAKVAWRNSNRCIGRLFWKSLKVRDRRELSDPSAIFEDLMEHLDFATNDGKIRPVLTVFSPSTEPTQTVRIWNKQLIRFAAYRQYDGKILGDPESVAFTELCESLGWEGKNTAFDVLPIVIQVGNQRPEWFEIPKDKVKIVPISHPASDCLDELGLQWYAVPVISDMVLEIGGVVYSCAPFNGWYMLTEIAARNLADSFRYDLLPVVAERLGLDTGSKRALWKDRALLVLQEAVLHSFETAGVTLVDHHEASEQFLEFCRIEAEKGREVQADWTWIVPPTAGSTTGVFHREWKNEVLEPNFFYADPAWKALDTEYPAKASGCPFHAVGEKSLI
ncbi:nitric oxide synthase oxygenase [Algoriphagus sp. H41]|uniref:Nitric oxide synthase oxygenase n=1 Tax=Algoriphagus oliviformis TaxID=2811231 RepID=A0ABS3BZ65_9BACT|nr:nitric oxide synthase oxygenase [Algoriphagus oliviformis]MBN7809973.1 nitric oxide synthase oxygenase [Algoriphagus oliviformis]